MNATTASAAARWNELADKSLAGARLTLEEGLTVLACPDDELLDLITAVSRVRRHYFANTVQFYFLMNAKSGLCPEDCGYCSQSKVSDAEIPRYNLVSDEALLDGARVAAEQGAKTYCMVISARGPSEREIDTVTRVVPEIKSRYGLDVCACLGLLTPEQARRLKESGVDKVNHNLNTSERHYAEICTTHTYADRLATLEAVRDAGMALCSGGILGMGERPEDVVRMALALRDLGVESIPVNFLNPVAGTPLEGSGAELNPRYCLKALCLFRLACPDREIRVAGGRELRLRSLQPMGLYVANSVFVGDYLTTKGQPAEDDYRMIEDLGFVVTYGQEEAIRDPGRSRPVRAASPLPILSPR